MDATTRRNPEKPESPGRRRFLGVDPGLQVTGYAVLEGAQSAPRMCEGGVIRTTSGQPIAARVAELYEGLCDVVRTFQPSAMALEQLFSVYRHPRTAILMGHARGVICLAAAQAGIPVVHYTATQVKKLLTGNGRASKQQVQRAVSNELALAQLPEPNDVADAFAVALCHFYTVRQRATVGEGATAFSKVVKARPSR